MEQEQGHPTVPPELGQKIWDEARGRTADLGAALESLMRYEMSPEDAIARILRIRSECRAKAEQGPVRRVDEVG